MVKKIVVFAFNGELMCFAHALLNAQEMHEKGYDVKLIIEGSATKLIKMFHEQVDAPFEHLYRKIMELNIIDCVCKACSSKMGVLEAVKKEKLPLCDEMAGHPSISKYMEKGYTILTF
jgi:hypothetical protein